MKKFPPRSCPGSNLLIRVEANDRWGRHSPRRMPSLFLDSGFLRQRRDSSKAIPPRLCCPYLAVYIRFDPATHSSPPPRAHSGPQNTTIRDARRIIPHRGTPSLSQRRILLHRPYSVHARGSAFPLGLPLSVPAGTLAESSRVYRFTTRNHAPTERPAPGFRGIDFPRSKRLRKPRDFDRNISPY
jgi:hypothetical protein